jgi:toxin ParE1/3/4
MTAKVTQPARRDIRGIVGYIAKDNPRAAERFANDLVGKFATLDEAPLIGREHADFGAGIRLFPFGSYLIVYRSEKAGIVIMRVLHGARNLPEAFEKD